MRFVGSTPPGGIPGGGAGGAPAAAIAARAAGGGPPGPRVVDRYGVDVWVGVDDVEDGAQVVVLADRASLADGAGHVEGFR